MKNLTFFVAMLFAAQLHAQDVKGYYVTESGKTVRGFFEEGDFNNSKTLKFKETRNASGENMPLDIVEYGIEDLNLKYEKLPVKIDISTRNSHYKEPVWETKTLFLNVVVSGNASLYSYTKDYETKFFYKVKDKQEETEQLINKKYMLTDTETAVNKTFRQQLYNSVNCNHQKKVSEFVEIAYDKTILKNLFVAYNECAGGESKVYITKKHSDFKFGAFASVNSLNLGIEGARPAVSDQSSITFSAGVEGSYIFPSGGWELFIRAEFESLTTELNDSHDSGYNVTESTYKVDGVAVNVMVGPRYNFIISPKSNVFVDAAICVSAPFADINMTTIIYPINNGTPYVGETRDYDFRTGFAVNFGVGYLFNKKYSVALRYLSNRGFLEDVNSSYKAQLSRIGLSLGYRF